MSENLTILIDTNIIIHLEDNVEVREDYSELVRLCHKHKIDIFIHEKAVEDVQRDQNTQRRDITLSKLKKYQELKTTPADSAQLETLFGKIKNVNDEVDATLLYSLYIGAVNLLVTEDRGIAKRGENCHKAITVSNVAEALELIITLKEPILVTYPHVEERNCYELQLTDTFFDSLRIDYPGFNEWFYEKCVSERRTCWVIFDTIRALAALAIKKEESEADARKLNIPGKKILKLCLFKVAERARGDRYGEQLLKQAMDYCYRNSYDALYLTTYPHQTTLINTLEKFGFQQAKNKEEEQVYYKWTGPIEPNELSRLPGFEFHKIFWPRIKVSKTSKIHIIPIRPEYHQRLFPEYEIDPREKQLYFDLVKQVESKTPGNAIRKVYICKRQYKKLAPGDILFFYRTEDSIITTIGVVERADLEASLSRLLMLTGKRTVYSEYELRLILHECKTPLVINFYFSCHLDRPIGLTEAKKAGIIKEAPQSIAELPFASFKKLHTLISVRSQKIFNYE